MGAYQHKVQENTIKYINAAIYSSLNKMILTFALAIAISWIIGKIIKITIDINKKKFSSRRIFFDGGMPSAHTVSVVSMATAAFLETGFSALFVLSVVLALIVMDDAMKVRWITGEQSKAINKLTKGKKGYPILEERVGHKPIEVLVGIIIGIIVPIIIYALI